MIERYECALLQHLTRRVPVVPIYLADIEVDSYGQKSFDLFDAEKEKKQLPHAPHKRREGAQRIIDHLRYIFVIYSSSFALPSFLTPVFLLYSVSNLSHSHSLKSSNTEFLHSILGTIQRVSTCRIFHSLLLFFSLYLIC